MKKRTEIEIVGLDIDSSSVGYARDILGLEVKQGALGDVDLGDTAFDFITMFHFLEHDYEANRTLSKAWKILKPGGKIIIVVPNFGSLERKIFGANWFSLELPRHLLHFTPDTLCAMLKKNNFTKIIMKPLLLPLSFVGSLGNLFKKQYFRNVEKNIFSIFFLSVLSYPLVLLLYLISRTFPSVLFVAEKQEVYV